MRWAKLLALALAFGCSKEAPREAATENAVVKRWERGPLTVDVRVEPKEPTIVDPIAVTIEATIEKDYVLAMPEFGEGLGAFAIRDWRTETPEEKDGKILHRIRYELDVFLSGDYAIEPMLFSFAPASEGGAEAPPSDAGAAEEGEKTYKLKTEAFSIAVKPIAEDGAALGTVEPPAGPEELPEPPRRMVLSIALAAAGVLAIGTAVFLLLRRRLRRIFTPPPLPPHEVAYLELKALIDENLIAAGRIKEFYFRLTAIVRQYIENRFGLRAPEQTTEEFLAGAATAGHLSAEHQALLRTFLNHADLVKFAKMTPQASDIENSFNAARAFINDTIAAPESPRGGSHVPA